MRIFKTKVFDRFARKAGITDHALLQAIAEAERGLVAADLGGGVIKQRVARAGGGKSGGFRTVILYRSAARAVFVYGFAKSERDNIGAAELAVFRQLANAMLGYGEAQIGAAIRAGIISEVSFSSG